MAIRSHLTWPWPPSTLATIHIVHSDLKPAMLMRVLAARWTMSSNFNIVAPSFMISIWSNVHSSGSQRARKCWRQLPTSPGNSKFHRAQHASFPMSAIALSPCVLIFCMFQTHVRQAHSLIMPLRPIACPPPNCMPPPCRVLPCHHRHPLCTTVLSTLPWTHSRHTLPIPWPLLPATHHAGVTGDVAHHPQQC